MNIEAVDEVRCEDKAVGMRMETRLMGLAIGWVEGRGSWSLVSGEVQELLSEGTYGAKIISVQAFVRGLHVGEE